jgi:hypothetical protein
MDIADIASGSRLQIGFIFKSSVVIQVERVDHAEGDGGA